MQHTLVAVFDNRSDAQQAMDELLAASFSSSNVKLSQGDTSTTASSDDGESIGASIKHFFSDIFGSDDGVHTKRYENAVTRGHHVLTVGPVSEPEVERAADIVERFGPVDIDEESSSDVYGGAGVGADQIMRRDSASLQGSQSLSFQNDDRQPFQQGNLNDAVPMGGTYQEPSGGNSNLSNPGGQRLSSDTAGMSMQDGTQQGSFQRGDIGSGGSSGSNIGGTGASSTGLNRPGMRVFPRDPLDTDNDSAYRNHWSSTYGMDSGSYDDYAPAYSYGSSLKSDDKYRGRSWDDAESDIRSDWETRNAGTTSTWDKMKAAVRHGWDRITS